MFGSIMWMSPTCSTRPVAGLAREVVERLDLGSLESRHEQLLYGRDILRCHEVHQFEPFLGLGHVASRDVAQSRVELPEQLVARRGNQDKRERPLVQLLRVFLVEVALAIAHVLRGDPALASFVVEKERPALGNQHADHTPPQHLLEVALPRHVREAELALWGCRRLVLRERNRRCQHRDEQQRPEPWAIRSTQP